MTSTLQNSAFQGSERILVCDDDVPLRKRLARSLRDRGYVVFEAGGVEESRGVLLEFGIDVCLVDMRMPGENGMMLLEYISHGFPDVRSIVFTGFGTIQNATEAMKKGAVEYLTKPASIDEIIAAVSRKSEKKENPEYFIEMPSLEEVEMEYIQKVLAECEGNITAAAKVLGLHRRSLQRKLARG
jgi:two-component system, response regulator RegA